MSEGPRLTDEEVAPYLQALDWLLALLGHDEVAAAWDRPSALARYTTGGVAAHAVHGVRRLVQLLHDPEPPADHPVGLLDYFGPNRMAEPTGDDPLFVALREGAERAAGRGPASLVEAAGVARDELAHLLPATPATRAIPVVRVPGGTTTLSDYLRTRVLEVVVHGDDLVASVPDLTVPDPPPAALDMCLGVCVELARGRLGDLGALRAFTRAERADPGALRVL